MKDTRLVQNSELKKLAVELDQHLSSLRSLKKAVEDIQKLLASSPRQFVVGANEDMPEDVSLYERNGEPTEEWAWLDYVDHFVKAVEFSAVEAWKIIEPHYKRALPKSQPQNILRNVLKASKRYKLVDRGRFRRVEN